MYTRLPHQLVSNRAGPNTRCQVRLQLSGAQTLADEQKCLKLGHHTYECKNARPYVPRQSHTKQLASGSKRDKPSVEVPEEFKQGLQGREGLADRILKAKEEERERIRLEDEKRQAKARRAAEKEARKASRSSVKRSVRAIASENVIADVQAPVR